MINRLSSRLGLGRRSAGGGVSSTFTSSRRYLFSGIVESLRRKKTVQREQDAIDLVSRYCNAMQLLSAASPPPVSSSSSSNNDSSSGSSSSSSSDNNDSNCKIAESLKEVSARGFGVMEYKKIAEMLQIHIKAEFSSSAADCINSICHSDKENIPKAAFEIGEKKKRFFGLFGSKNEKKDNTATTDSIVASSGSNSKQLDVNASLRLQLFQEYLNSLNNAITEGDLKVESIDLIVFNRLIDAFMKGSADDRIRDHLHLYGNKITQYQFQSAFHALFEPELAIVKNGYLAQITDKKILKDETKEMKKFERVYLLDTLELNTKARSVFCWNDPNFRGFVAVSEETEVPVAELIETRKKYFKEASTLASKFMADYLGQKRSKLVRGKERRENIVKGILFFVSVSILDNLIALM